jgi:hypothetical protein
MRQGIDVSATVNGSDDEFVNPSGVVGIRVRLKVSNITVVPDSAGCSIRGYLKRRRQGMARHPGKAPGIKVDDLSGLWQP